MPADPAKAADVLKFFDWAYKNGDKLASDLDYVPLPDNVVELIHQEWKRREGQGRQARLQHVSVAGRR